MRWVEIRSYIGLDRRQKGAFRLLDRRGKRNEANAPSLNTALRQLRLTCVDADDAEGFEAFAVRARGVAQLAEAHGFPAVSARLLQVVETLKLKADAGEYVAVVAMLERVMPEIEAAAGPQFAR
jgi:hypothetical protein